MRGRLILLLALFVPLSAWADGGQILLHQTAGAITVTVFGAPEPLSTGDADLSILVQDAASHATLSDADATLTLTPPGGGQPITLTPSRTAGRLFPSTALRFDQPGLWTLTVHTEQATFSAIVPIAASHSRQTAIALGLILPPLIIIAFALHQQQRRRLRARTENSLSS